MKQLMMAMTVVLAATTFAAAPKGKNKNVKAMAGADEVQTTGKEAKILIDQMPKTGQQSTLAAPAVPGASMIGQCYTKPRKWIVIETKYTTYAKFLDQLTFNWHVVLDAKSAKENKGNKLGLDSQYSYFNTSVSYYNIPQGSHAACVCLPPSYLELYGEARAIGFTITNQNGDELGGGTVSEIKGIANDSKFWEDQDGVMNKMGANGKPLIERRQGLMDRSKTIWALVNPNDYETTMQ